MTGSDGLRVLVPDCYGDSPTAVEAAQAMGQAVPERVYLPSTTRPTNSQVWAGHSRPTRE